MKWGLIMQLKNEDSKSPSNIKDINIDASFLHLIQIHDSAFPTGMFSHSFGMETYMIQDDVKDSDSVIEFCEMYLRHSIGTTDAILVKEAFNLAQKNDLNGLMRLESICHSIKLALEARNGSSMLGRQFIRTVSQISDDTLLSSWQKKIKDKEITGHYPIAYGIYTASLGVELEIAISTYLYASVASLVQNAVRAVPIGQNAGVKAVFKLLPIVQEVTLEVFQKTLDDLNNHAIALEIAQMKHEFVHARLFMS